MTESFATLLPRLRAIAEPSRLRLLAILARGELSVSELTGILGQSQPRVSRHLKLLGDAGLLERFREQHWICYRVAAPDQPAGRFVRDLLERMDPDDPVLRSDEARLAAVLEERARGGGEAASHVAASVSLDEELAAAVASELNDAPYDSLLYYGTSPAGVLAGLSRRAGRVTGMHGSRREVQRARAVLHSRGLSHCVLQQGDLRALPQPSASVEVAIVDRVLGRDPRPAEALREVARVMNPGGRLLIVEDYDELADHAPSQNPLALVRGWIEQGGLVCERLRPVDVARSHVLLAVATSERAAAAA